MQIGTTETGGLDTQHNLSDCRTRLVRRSDLDAGTSIPNDALIQDVTSFPVEAFDAAVVTANISSTCLVVAISANS